MKNFWHWAVNILPCGTPNNRLRRREGTEFTLPASAFLGIFFEAVVLTVSFALIAGVRFPKWYYLGVEALYTIGLFFAYWLFTQSYFVIHVLCPWCLLITITTTLVWFGLTRVCISQGVLPAPAWWRSVMKAGGDWLLVVLVIAAVLAMIVVRYGSVLFGN